MSVMISSIFFVVKPEWIEQLRAITGRGEVAWVKYSPDPNDLRDNDLTFEVRFPGKPTKLEPPIAGLPIKGARYADPERPFQDEFLVGYGRIAKILPGGAWLADQIWFDKVKTELLQATQAKIISESDRPFQNYSSRLYVLQLPEDANGPRTRILRLVRVGDLQLFLLSIEGSYLNQENVMVKRFLDSLRVMPNRKVK
jgi:hypothetical protein